MRLTPSSPAGKIGPRSHSTRPRIAGRFTESRVEIVVQPNPGRVVLRRTVIASALVGSVLVLLAGLAAAQAKKPDATLTLSEGSVAVGIGFSWGKGTLSYQGKTYPFKVDGLSVGEVGLTRASAAGNVFNLKKLADFSGSYTAGAAEADRGRPGHQGRQHHEEPERRRHRAEEHDPGRQPQAGGRGHQADPRPEIDAGGEAAAPSSGPNSY